MLKHAIIVPVNSATWVDRIKKSPFLVQIETKIEAYNIGSGQEIQIQN